MKKKKLILLAPLAILALLLFIALGGEIVQHLWNWLLPPLFGWRLITFWQALGMLALCRILFGGFGFHDSHQSKFPPPQGGSLGVLDTGRARTIPARHARRLRLRAIRQRDLTHCRLNRYTTSWEPGGASNDLGYRLPVRSKHTVRELPFTS